jgi:hypothetical protein
MFVAMGLPSGDFFFKRRFVGNAAIQAWVAQNGEFGFGQVADNSSRSWT